jgi:excisionase family DNA binding protein
MHRQAYPGGLDVADTLLTPAEVAERLRISERTLEFSHYQGRGPAFVRVGKRVRYSAQDVDGFIEAQRSTMA